jgi:hypothetical protein
VQNEKCKIQNEKIEIWPLSFAPAAEDHGLCPWVNAPTFGRNVAPLGRNVIATGYGRGVPQSAICSFQI